MSHFVDLCAVEDLRNGASLTFEVEGVPVLLMQLNGRYYALRNRCTHLDFPLAGGRQTGFEIACRQHGARFDVRSGNALSGPAVTPVPVYEVRITAGRLEVCAPA